MVEFLARLDHLDIRLRVEDRRLKCSAPDGVLTPALVDEIALRKAEIVAYLDVVAADSSLAPATFAQERLWFLHHLEGGSSHDNQAEVVVLEGPLDRSAIEHAFRQIVRRHAILRSNFRNEAGRLRLVERPVEALVLGDADLSSEPDPLAAARLWANSLILPSFDLENEPLLRIAIARLGREYHALVVVMHHIICDGWSTGIFFNELAAFYAGAAPAPLPFDFAAAARRERARRDEAALNHAIAWWQRTLEGAPPKLELPTDRRPSIARDFVGARIALALSADETKALEELGRTANASLYMVLLAVYTLLLARHADVDDIVIGAPVADRIEPEFEPLIGHFLNTLALRIRLDGAPSLRELIARTRSVVLDAFDHKELPFGRLVQALNPERDLSHAPVVQAFFILHNVPRPVFSLQGLTVSLLPDLPVSCDYLTLNLYPDESGNGRRLTGSLDYNVALFDKATAERLAARLLALVQSAIADPDLPIDQLALESPADRTAAADLCGTDISDISPLPLPLSFSAQARQNPDAIAVMAGQEIWTYAQLDARSDAIAGKLAACGIGMGDRVGIAFPRGANLVAALLGVLKAGAAYVPLDPDLPAARLSTIAQDAALAAILFEAAIDPDKFGVDCPFIDAGLAADSSASKVSLPRPLSPQDPAYLLYTSGSTGQPKGVLVHHDGLVHLLRALGEKLGLRAADRLLAVTTISFDIAALELFVPLLTGMTLIVADRRTASDGHALAQLVADSGATVMQATPATWQMLLAAGWRGGPGFRMLCGGEALSTELARALTVGGAELWNLYGPTETTIWSTAHRVGAADLAPDADAMAPIGKPIGATIVRTCDRAGRRLPAGIPGELLIGGRGVALGYHRRPLQTAERFVLHDAARFYRTGDRVRQRQDGTLLFLGRADEQIKLRGFRIEPAEIEAALLTHPAVRQAIVVRREARAGDARLVAYVVPSHADAPPEPAQLRATAGAILPDYMVPSAFVMMERLPMTASGKIDRRSLPDSQPGAHQHRAPVTDAERAVAAIWEEILDHRPIGLDDNFFALGGHSLLTISVQQRLAETFGRSLDVASLFRHPTLAGLARFLADASPQPDADAPEELALRLRIKVAAQQRRRRLVSGSAHG